jgi:hypothetical protein
MFSVQKKLILQVFKLFAQLILKKMETCETSWNGSNDCKIFKNISKMLQSVFLLFFICEMI